MQYGFNHIVKLDFLEAYPTVYGEAFKTKTIQSGFMAAGIYLFDLD